MQKYRDTDGANIYLVKCNVLFIKDNAFLIKDGAVTRTRIELNSNVVQL